MEKAKRFKLKVEAKDSGTRLDQYIIKKLNPALACKGWVNSSISRSQLQRLINAGEISINPATALPDPSRTQEKRSQGISQRPPKANYKVKQNDLLLINIPPAEKPRVLPEAIPLEIIFEDTDIMVVNKPAGMVTHPAAGNFVHTLVNALLHYGCELSSINGPLRPGIVHRLDKDTSGLIVIAKNNLSHQRLAEQFRQHTVQRKYIALVKGRLAHDQGAFDYPLARHPRNRQKIAVSFVKKAKSALTRYTVLKRYRDFTLVELRPYTGRTHQLRVHLNFSGHPILGDPKYGKVNEFERMALHAQELGFRHPRTEKPVQFKTDIPQCFKRLQGLRDTI